MPPVRYKVGYHSSHEAPETKIIMRSSSQSCFVIASNMFHHPYIHYSSITYNNWLFHKHVAPIKMRSNSNWLLVQGVSKKLTFSKLANNYIIFGAFLHSKVSSKNFRFWGFQNCPYIPKLMKKHWRYLQSKLLTLKFCSCSNSKSINKIFEFSTALVLNVTNINPLDSSELNWRETMTLKLRNTMKNS